MQVVDEHPDYAGNDKHDCKNMDRDWTLDKGPLRTTAICKIKHRAPEPYPLLDLRNVREQARPCRILDEIVGLR